MSGGVDWKVARIIVLAQLTRCHKLSVGARITWAELAFNWCWDDEICFPNLVVLAEAIGKGRNAIGRWIAELEEVGLLRKRHKGRGFQFELATVFPEELIDPKLVNNRDLSAAVKASRKHDATRRRAPKECTTEHDPCIDVHRKGANTCTDSVHVIEKRALKGCTDVHQKGARIEVHIKGSDEKDEAIGKGRMREAGNPLAHEKESVSQTGDEDHEGSTDGKEKTYESSGEEGADLSELMEDNTQPLRKKRRRRGPSADLVGLSGDGLRTASEPRGETFAEEPTPRPPETPEDVLALLRGEVEAKYGPSSCRSLPRKLTGVQRGKIQRAILDAYDADVVIALVRILVWDWEVARTVCFPYRHDADVPPVDALPQYHAQLAAAISSGLNYNGVNRGTQRTYAWKYLKRNLSTEALSDFFRDG